MRHKNDHIIPLLERVVEDIDNLSLGDEDAWNSLSIRLARLADDFQTVPEEVSRAFGLGIKGLETGSGDLTGSQRLTILRHLSDLLTAALGCLRGDPECYADDLARAMQVIDAMLDAIGNNRPGCDVAAASESPGQLERALHDAAALLLQSEPHDSSSLFNLRACLESLAVRDGMCEEAIEKLSEARFNLDRYVEDGEGEGGRLLQDIGVCFEEVLEIVTSGGGLPSIASEGSEPEAEGPRLAEDDGGENTNYMPDEADQELLGEFVAEGLELIMNAEEALLALETDPEDMEAVATVFRAFHTIKGTSAFLELGLISEMGHHAENLLSRVRQGEIRYSGGYADMALRALDMLKELIQAVQESIVSGWLSKPDGYDGLLEILSAPEVVTGEENDLSAEESGRFNEADRLGDILVEEGTVSPKIIEKALANDLGRPLGAIPVEEKGVKTDEVARALRTQRKARASDAGVESTVRVSTSRLDRLVDLVGELVIAHSMVAQDELMVFAGHHEIAKKVSHTSKIIRELQDLSMSMRMIPLKGTFNKMARLVRDLTRKVGKNVNLLTEGEETEIDRNMVDVVNDPLVHMIRNAVDHGIETPEERRRVGKPEQGTIQLSAYHAAGNVVVEIRDDGRGLDRTAIVEKARQEGLLQDDAALSEREIYNLIFEPGFSTAKTVTDVSGRGVGMDVVKKNIEKLRGQVDIQSRPGQGSVFRMSLPLTLAIIDGMVVRVGEERYVVPTVSIVRAVKPQPNEISTVMGKGEMLSLQGELLPLFRLGSVFHVQRVKQEAGEPLAVVIEDDGVKVGLVVDELIGRQQTVIKSLGDTMREVPGIAGGAIMPNGRVGLIVDIAGLVRLAHGADGGHGVN